MEEKIKIKSSVGVDIACRIWKDNKKEYKGIIQIVHGMQEHIGRYIEFAEFLAKEGYIVVGHDQLGHGDTVNSEEEYGHFSDTNGWEKLVEDINIVYKYIKEKYPNLKYILFGHSMGSILVRTYITKYNNPIDKVIICGTTKKRNGIRIGIGFIKILKVIFGKKYKSAFVEYLVTGSFNKKFEQKTRIDWISRDNETIKKFVSDKKCLKNFTLQAYEDLLKGTLYVSKQKNINKSMKIPLLFISGDMDPVGGYGRGIIKIFNMYQKTNEKVDIRLLKNARHEILNELDKEFVYTVIVKWIEK